MNIKDYTRALCGLTPAELPDSIFDDAYIPAKVDIERRKVYADNIAPLDENNLTEEDLLQLDYMAYKAILLLKASISMAVPESIKDNFNSFTRFNNLDDLFEEAEGFVNSQENKNLGKNEKLLTIVSPSTDPVTGV